MTRIILTVLVFIFAQTITVSLLQFEIFAVNNNENGQKEARQINISSVRMFPVVINTWSFSNANRKGD